MGATGTAGKLLAAAIAAALLAAPALAQGAKGKGAKGKAGAKSGKIKERAASVSATGPTGTPLSATATCPKGTKAISGGFSSGPAGSSGAVSTYESVRVGARSWRVSGVLILGSGTVSQTLTTYAYCRAGPTPKVGSTATTVPIGTGAVVSGSAATACPRKTSAISGGYLLSLPTNETASILNESMRQGGRGWRIGGLGFSTAGVATQPATVFAYCLPGKVGRVVAAGSGAPSGVVSTAIAPTCPRRVASGGFSVPGQPGSVPVITESKRATGSQWQASTVVSGQANTLTTLGYCT